MNIITDFCFSVADDGIRNGHLRKTRGSGTYKRFKDAFIQGIEEEWYRFRQEAREKIAIEWLEANQVPYAKDK